MTITRVLNDKLTFCSPSQEKKCERFLFGANSEENYLKNFFWLDYR